MFKLFSRKKVLIYLPYKIKIDDNPNILIFEASGPYNEDYLYFHCLMELNNEEEARRIYILLNETIEKYIHINVSKNYVEEFKFVFEDYLSEEDLKNIKIYDYKLLKEGTI